MTTFHKIVKRAVPLAISGRDAGFPDSSFFLCKELIPGYLHDVTGIYQTPQGYYVKDEDVDEFDKGFPPKEKRKLPGQIFG